MCVHGGCDHAHPASDLRAVGRGHEHGRAGFDAAQFGGRDFGAPLEPALADQAKHFHARTQHRAYRCAAGRNGAAVGCQKPGMTQAQLLCV